MSRRKGYFYEPRELPCGDSRLVIAFSVDRWWDAVYYQPRFEGDTIGRRFSITKRILLDAIRVLFAEAGEPFDADTMIDYIRRQAWGVDLPQLEAKREPVMMPQDERLAMEHGEDPYQEEKS